MWADRVNRKGMSMAIGLHQITSCSCSIDKIHEFLLIYALSTMLICIIMWGARARLNFLFNQQYLFEEGF